MDPGWKRPEEFIIKIDLKKKESFGVFKAQTHKYSLKCLTQKDMLWQQ